MLIIVQCRAVTVWEPWSVRTGDGNCIGGLVGYNLGGEISNSYSVCEVSGYWDMGGLVGNNQAEGVVENCYATGPVEVGDYNAQYYSNNGVLIGVSDGAVLNCHYYVFGGKNNGIGESLDDGQIMTKGSFVGFDFVGDSTDGTEDVWDIVEGYMPKLVWQEGDGYGSPVSGVATTLAGSGTERDPFIIADKEDLLEFKNNSELRIGHFQLTNDIILAGDTYESSFIAEEFNGYFHGNWHTIYNLNISEPSGDRTGFFKEIGMAGSVYALRMKNLNIEGYNHVGGVCGYNGGLVVDCSASGNLTGNSFVGGVCGWNGTGVVDGCYSDCQVDSFNYSGCLVGTNDNAIYYSVAEGKVTGNYRVGGLVGWMAYDNCYVGECIADCEVIGQTGIGGFIGGGYASGQIWNCNSYGVTTGNSQVGGFIGENGVGIYDCFASGHVVGSTIVGGFAGANNEKHISYSLSVAEVTASGTVGGFLRY